MYNHKVEVRLSHTDAAGIVFFAHVLTLAHDCYEAFLSEHLPLASIIESTDFLMPIVHSSADYHKPIRLSDKLDIEMSLGKYGNSSFEFLYRFTDDAGRLCAEVRTAHVVVDKGTFKSRPIPDSVAQVLSHLR